MAAVTRSQHLSCRVVEGRAAARAVAHAAFRSQRELGMLLGVVPSAAGRPARRQALRAAFYEGDAWRGELEVRALPTLDEHAAVVVEVAADLWSAGPVSCGDHRGRGEAVVVPHFALTTVHGPGWDESCGIREQSGWAEHAAFMDGLVTDGFLVLGGPLGNGQRTLHAVEAADEDEVCRRMAEDPWARSRLLEVGSIEPWTLWLDSRGATTDGPSPGPAQPRWAS